MQTALSSVNLAPKEDVEVGETWWGKKEFTGRERETGEDNGGENVKNVLYTRVNDPYRSIDIKSLNIKYFTNQLKHIPINVFKNVSHWLSFKLKWCFKGEIIPLLHCHNNQNLTYPS